MAQVDVHWAGKKLAVWTRENTDDRRACLAKGGLLDDGIAELGFHDCTDRVDSYIIKEKMQQLLIELSVGAVRHDLVDDIRFISFFVRPVAGQGIIDIGDCNNACERMDVLALQMIRIAAAVHVLMVLSGDIAQRRSHEIVELAQFLPAGSGMAADDFELVITQGCRLIQDIYRHDDFADIVQQCTERKRKQLFTGKAAECSEHGGKNSDIDRMSKGIRIMQPDIGNLDQIIVLGHDIEQQLLRSRLQRGYIDAFGVLKIAERIKDRMDGLDACLLGNNVFRRGQRMLCIQ